jgi:hypothetical protein
MLTNVTSKSIFNMSVSLEKNSENNRDRGKSRYDSPTLRSFQLYPANLRCTDLVLTTYEDRDPL